MELPARVNLLMKIVIKYFLGSFHIVKRYYCAESVFVIEDGTVRYRPACRSRRYNRSVENEVSEIRNQ